MGRTYRVNAFTRLVNLPFGLLGRLGLGADFRYLLTVRGRRTGRPYSTPIDAIDFEGRRWLVAAYGVTNWVRNLRASGEVELTRGSRTTRVRAREVSPEEGAAVLRRYLELVPVTRPYVDVPPNAPASDFQRAVRSHPVFELRAMST